MRSLYISIQARFLCILTSLLIVSVVTLCGVSSALTSNILLDMKRETLNITTLANLYEVQSALHMSFKDVLYASLQPSTQKLALGVENITTDTISKQIGGSGLISETLSQLRIYWGNASMAATVNLWHPVRLVANYSNYLYPLERSPEDTIQGIQTSGVSTIGPVPHINGTQQRLYIMSITLPIIFSNDSTQLVTSAQGIVDSPYPTIGYVTGIINTNRWDINASDPAVFTALARLNTGGNTAQLLMPMHNLNDDAMRNYRWNQTINLQNRRVPAGNTTSEWDDGILITAAFSSSAIKDYIVVSNELRSAVGDLANSLVHALIICACLTVVIGFVVLALVSRARTRQLLNLIIATGHRKRVLDESRNGGEPRDVADVDSQPTAPTLVGEKKPSPPSPTNANSPNSGEQSGDQSGAGNEHSDPVETKSAKLVKRIRIPWLPHLSLLKITDEATDMSLRIDSIFEALVKRYKVLEEHVEARQNQIAIAKKAADNANAAKTHFLARVTHELRTPLNGILGTASLCMDETDIVQVRSSLKTIYKCGELLLHLLTDLLSFSQHESESTALDEQEFMMQDVTTQIVAIFREQTEKGRTRLELEVDEDCQQTIVFGDLNRILQVVFNLLSNSLKFTPDGGKVKFCVRAEKIDEGQRRRVIFVVSDNGPGIAEHLQSRVFEAFVQGDINSVKVRKAGVGLGLSICRQLAQRMGGTITLRSDLGKGAEFTFTVPLRYIGMQNQPQVEARTDAGLYPEYEHYSTGTVLRRAEAEIGVSRKLSSNTCYTIGQSSQSTSTTGGAPSIDRADSNSSSDRGSVSVRPGITRSMSMEGTVNPSLRVLVADDNKVNQEVMMRMLNLEGLKNISVADDGIDAIEKTRAASARGELFDIIFMDVQMPNCDGKKATQELRNLGYTLPIVAVSAFANEDNVEACLEAGMNLFLGKPLKRPSLHRLLQGLQDISSLSI